MDETSMQNRREAYYETRDGAKTLRKKAFQTLKEMGNATSEELMARLGLVEQIRPRLTELKDSGLIEVCGKRRSERTGKNIAVYCIAEKYR